SKLQQGLIWAGTNDGQIWYTKNGGTNWTNVTKNIKGMLASGTVTSIEPSHFDPGSAYVSVDFHLVDNRDPFIYKTSDFGTSWTTSLVCSSWRSKHLSGRSGFTSRARLSDCFPVGAR